MFAKSSKYLMSRSYFSESGAVLSPGPLHPPLLNLRETKEEDD